MNIQNWTIPKKRKYIFKNGSRKKRFRGRSFPIFLAPTWSNISEPFKLKASLLRQVIILKFVPLVQHNTNVVFFFVYLERLNKFLEQRNWTKIIEIIQIIQIIQIDNLNKEIDTPFQTSNLVIW